MAPSTLEAVSEPAKLTATADDNPPQPPHGHAVTVRLDDDVSTVAIGARAGLLWSHGGFTLAGVGEAGRIRVDRPGGHGRAAEALGALVGPGHESAATPDWPGTGPVALAALPFDPKRSGELVVPRIVVGSDGQGRRWLTVIGPQDASPADLAASAKAEIDGLMAEPATGDEPTTFDLASVLPPEVWRDEIVAGVTARIRDGELTKAVLARELVLKTDVAIRPQSVIDRLHAVFPTAALFLVDGFVGASPELLVSRLGDVVRAHPLAGTASRSSDPALDQRQAASLLGSKKDRWEHRITIDWLLDNLLPFCSYVDAEPEPSIVTLANVHHLGTLVEGRLSGPASSVLELVAALHPTPAVGGMPQADALALIGAVEQAERGRYAGPVGWVDSGGNGAFAVGLRSAQLGGLETRLFAGVGVVADSDPSAELAETRAKFRAMLGALIVP